jgi:hypothetical protein
MKIKLSNVRNKGWGAAGKFETCYCKTLIDIIFQKILIEYADKTVTLSIKICYSNFQHTTCHNFSTIALKVEYKFMFVHFNAAQEAYKLISIYTKRVAEFTNFELS